MTIQIRNDEIVLVFIKSLINFHHDNLIRNSFDNNENKCVYRAKINKDTINYLKLLIDFVSNVNSDESVLFDA